MSHQIRFGIAAALLGLCVALLLYPNTMDASGGTSATPATAGESRAAEIQFGVCVHCHGAHGEGRPELNGPRIGDLDAGYVKTQLLAYKNGSRAVNPEHPGALAMVAIAKGLPDERSIATLASFTAALTPEYRAKGNAVPSGTALFAPCVTCHGPDATGKAELGTPNLLYQDGAYLTRQLKNYRDGTRSAHGGAPLSGGMGAMTQQLSDGQIDTLVAHIASLRPERPPLRNYDVSVSTEDGLRAFADIYAVSMHPRCLNCHPAGDAPLHTDASIRHDFGIDRFSPLVGVHCSTCHAAAPVGDGLAPLPPADPIWSLAPKAMVFEGRTPKQLCEQLKDPQINGGRGHVDTTAHVANDHLLQTSWHSGRTVPPISHAELVKRFETWGRAGGPCPE